MPNTWSGHFYDGIRTTRNPVTISLTAKSVIIVKADQTTIEWPIAEIRQTQGFYAGEPVKLERGRESLVIAASGADNDFLKALKTITTKNDSRFKIPQTTRTRFLRGALAAVAGVAVIVSLYIWIIPYSADTMAEKIPPSWEEKLGNSVVDDMLKRSVQCTDKKSKEAVAKIMARLNAAAMPHPYVFRVHIIKGKLMNAFALPGGHILVFTGLIEKTDRPEELAGVLAHEMQHVLKRHSTKRIIQSLSTGMLLTVMVGDMSRAINAINVLNNMRYSRLAEKEADESGLSLMKRARIDPVGMIDFFVKMEKEHGSGPPSALSYISTHPATNERIAYIKKNIPAGAAAFEKILPEFNWAEISKLCKSSSKEEPLGPESCEDDSGTDEAGKDDGAGQVVFQDECKDEKCTDAPASGKTAEGGPQRPDLGQRPVPTPAQTPAN